MRPKFQSFEQLVKENKQELLQDEKSLQQIELRLEKKQSAMAVKNKKRFSL
ncbi:FbpB family small basic protein [Virgibacillus byunsanensis]|uniref:FbpB family small basic protein n=1 Tax=Virgibacillus byunsanensis TaxID=570945 RepID=A0ABW3LNT8_9BACI